MLLKFDSEEAVSWFQSSKAVRKSFSSKFHKNAEVKHRAFHNVVHLSCSCSGQTGC